MYGVRQVAFLPLLSLAMPRRKLPSQEWSSRYANAMLKEKKTGNKEKMTGRLMHENKTLHNLFYIHGYSQCFTQQRRHRLESVDRVRPLRRAVHSSQLLKLSPDEMDKEIDKRKHTMPARNEDPTGRDMSQQHPDHDETFRCPFTAPPSLTPLLSLSFSSTIPPRPPSDVGRRATAGFLFPILRDWDRPFAPHSHLVP